MVKTKPLSTKFKRIDLFATNIAFRENEGDSFGSIFGACSTLLIALIVASYGFKKILVMYDHGDTSFNEFT